MFTEVFMKITPLLFVGLGVFQAGIQITQVEDPLQFIDKISGQPTWLVALGLFLWYGGKTINVIVDRYLTYAAAENEAKRDADAKESADVRSHELRIAEMREARERESANQRIQSESADRAELRKTIAELFGANREAYTSAMDVVKAQIEANK